MESKHLDLGKEGEHQARIYLEGKGFVFIEKNFRAPFGEIDLIMRDQSTLVFVEVRTKTDPDQVHPLETVTSTKRTKIIKTAMAYLKKNRQYDVLCRFDVLAMIPLTPLDWEIEHIEHAFEVAQFS